MRTHHLTILGMCVALAIVLIILISQTNLFNNYNNKVIGNQQILKEIDKLLLPVSLQNITENNFNTLEGLVKSDAYATDEVNEIVILTRYHEYSHIGHGLGFLYDYIKTGVQPNCPGHALAHYFVFEKHGKSELAEESLEHAEESFPVWDASESAQNEATQETTNYRSNRALIIRTFENIESSKVSASEDEISALTDIPCANPLSTD